MHDYYRTKPFPTCTKESDKVATFLARHDVSAGQHVGVFATNTPEMVLAIIAVTKLGAVPALVNTALRSKCEFLSSAWPINPNRGCHGQVM